MFCLVCTWAQLCVAEGLRFGPSHCKNSLGNTETGLCVSLVVKSVTRDILVAWKGQQLDSELCKHWIAGGNVGTKHTWWLTARKPGLCKLFLLCPTSQHWLDYGLSQERGLLRAWISCLPQEQEISGSYDYSHQSWGHYSNCSLLSYKLLKKVANCI